MPILLDNPFNPGDLDPGKTYPYVKIIHIRIDIMSGIVVQFTFGNIINGEFLKGESAPMRNVIIDGEDYVEMATSQIDETCSGIMYEGIKKALYDYLVAKGHLVGQVV